MKPQMWRFFVSIVMLLCLRRAYGGLWPKSDKSTELRPEFLAIELATQPSPTIFTFDLSTRAQFLLAHNALRSRVTPPASNMLFMVWKGDLEHLAQQWVDNCQWGRDPDLNFGDSSQQIGQNIFAMDDKMMRNLSLKARDIVGEWASERSLYYYNSPTLYCPFETCGNYTQIVWAESLYLGCSSKVCSELSGSGLTSPAHFIVCNYSPGGLVKGKRPYEIGHPCSKCPAGFEHCVEYLCEAFPRCQPVTECNPVNTTDCLCERYPRIGASSENNACIRRSSCLPIFLVLFVIIFHVAFSPVAPPKGKISTVHNVLK